MNDKPYSAPISWPSTTVALDGRSITEPALPPRGLRVAVMAFCLTLMAASLTLVLCGVAVLVKMSLSFVFN